MESIIRQNITQHCLKNNLISPVQYGFVHGKSTFTNLLELINDISKERDGGNNVDSMRRLSILCLIHY